MSAQPASPQSPQTPVYVNPNSQKELVEVLEHTDQPIPEGENYHTGAVDGDIHRLLRSESLPAPTPSQYHPAPVTSTGPGSSNLVHPVGTTGVATTTLPLYPKRFNDDITDHGMSPGINGKGGRTHSTPQSPSISDLTDGQTGCAPTIPIIKVASPMLKLQHAASSPSLQALQNYSLHNSHPPLHGPSSHSIMNNGASNLEAPHTLLEPAHAHHHKNRFNHTKDEDQELAERDSHPTPVVLPLYEKDEHGVFKFAGVPSETVGFIKNRANAVKTFNEPPATGAGPRAAPVPLITATLASSTATVGNSTLVRGTSENDNSLQTRAEKLPYNRVVIDYATFQPSAELTEIAVHVRKCLELRTKFVWTPLRDETQYDIFETPIYNKPSLKDAIPQKDETLHFAFHEGIATSWKGAAEISAEGNQLFAAPNRKEFGMAMGTIMDFVISGPVKTFCHNRLHILEARFNLHELLNHDIEQLVQKSVPHRDFYNVRKIDNHVHHSACMNQKHLLRFIKAKLKKNSDEIVIIRDGKQLTLPQVFQSLNMTAYDLNVDTLDMHADKTFHRFDKFNLKYNPVGECWAAGTKLVMYDGSLKAVEQIVADSIKGIDQVLLGPNGPQHVVKGTAYEGNTGLEAALWSSRVEPSRPGLFRVDSLDSARHSFVVNQRHVLVVRFNTKPSGPFQTPGNTWSVREIVPASDARKAPVVVRITNFASKAEAQSALDEKLRDFVAWDWEGSVAEFMRCSPAVQKEALMFQSGLCHFELPAHSESLLGRLEALNQSQELSSQASWKIGAWLAGASDMAAGDVMLLPLLQSYGLETARAIPHDLLRESVDVRMALLAGLIESQGEYVSGDNAYVFTSPFPELMEGFCHLVRGLGFLIAEEKSFQGVWSLRITGEELHAIPVQQESMRATPSKQTQNRCAGFTVRQVEHGNYYSFTLDGDGKCLLSDFVVTHNSRLREIFLKYNNYIKGKYLAEITQQVFEDLESNKYQFAEYRLSIYGAKKDEWNALSDWVVDNNLFSGNVRWMIQVPRLYSIYKASGQIKNFGEMLQNIFQPLFEVTIDPTSRPKLHLFLQSCVGFDMVDDESLRERPFNESLPVPTEWDFEYDPPYALFAYYLYANLCALNKLRVFRGMNSFAFRPHSGEAGDIEHLAATFLLAKGINHGIMLQKSPALQYLYYLAQIGISVSPLSNNLLFLEYEKNPFPKFFKKGLNVTLSTDDPLMIHVTREPLVEEYSVAAQVWKLSAIDMSEIARNSVLQSGFEQQYKAHYIGNNYWRRSEKGNDIRQTNMPDIRIQFRAELLGEEFRMLQKHAKLPFTEALIDRII